MKKSFLSRGLLVIVLSLIFSLPLFAKDTPDLFLNGDLKDVEIILKNSNTLVPLRFCSEELKAVVNWDKSTQKITITKGEDVIVFNVGSLGYTHNAESKKLLVAPELINGVTYVPFRPLVETLDGVVLYNNEYKFINIYEPNSDAYAVHKALGSKNVTEKRFAMLEIPKKSFYASYGGSRGDTYIFPIGEASNYFFRYFSDEGTLFGMAYFEVHDGVAVQKWAQEQAGSTRTNIDQSPLLNHLGTGTDVKKTGVFPALSDNSFVGFYNRTTEYSKDEISSIVTIGNTVSLINEKGDVTPSLDAPNKLVFSPFGSLYYLMEFNEQ